MSEKSLKFCVVGIGLIGGSICMSLKRSGYQVDGYDIDEKSLSFALENKIIDGVATDYKIYDFIFVALPVEATKKFILSNSFKENAILSDICGVKRTIQETVENAALPVRYVGMHPMAGKEVSSVFNACCDLFDNASMVITHSEKTDKDAYATAKNIIKDLGFKRIVECSAEVHDKKIAYTSQLAHIVSNAYVKDDEIESCLGFTGGSFQDMTRIAGVDENMWASLYLANADVLIKNIDNLIENLKQVSSAIKSSDRANLISVLKEGSEQFTSSKANSFTKNAESFLNGEIITTVLHD